MATLLPDLYLIDIRPRDASENGLKQFCRLSFVYFVFAFAFSTVLRGGDLLHFKTAFGLLQYSAIGYSLSTTIFISIFIIGYVSRSRSSEVLHDVAFAVGGTVFLKLGYTLFKTSMTLVVPFFTDRFMADLDAFLHFGHDPWEVLHLFSDSVSVWFAEAVYVRSWFTIAFGFPLLLAATDADHERRNRFLVLNGLAWVGLGNLLAVATMSSGPIYYDFVTGEERFAALQQALSAAGLADSMIGRGQVYLWEGYSNFSSALGSGISAFPSVHVAMATVFALYIAERWKLMRPVAFAYVAAIQFLSVYLGWHYAVDGYASIMIILAAYAYLRSANRQSTGSESLAA